MKLTMFSLMWLTSWLAVLVADTRIGAIHQKGIEPRRCHSCAGASDAPCDVAALRYEHCPADRPYCATHASAPKFTSSLICAAPAATTCSLTYSEKKTVEMICICPAHLCNTPFNPALQNELISFASTLIHKNDSVDLADSFWRSSRFRNATEPHLYKTITIAKSWPTAMPPKNLSEFISVNAVTLTITMPRKIATDTVKMMESRVESVKVQPTMPSDDEEDEGEASGAVLEDVPEDAPEEAPEDALAPATRPPPAASAARVPTPLPLSVLALAPVLLLIVA